MSKERDRRSVLITAGPTREAIDPVRYITNYSSGKMGVAIAEAFLEKGFAVVLVSGPVTLSLAHPDLTNIAVHSADEMYEACRPYFSTVGTAVFAAAVADYKPAEVFTEKMKKSENALSLQMIKNGDIAFEFGKIKQKEQVSVGFALETNDEEQNALKKLAAKNLDMVILNPVQDKGATFGYDTNKINRINRDLLGRTFPLRSKKEAGKDLAEAAISFANHQQYHQHSLHTNRHDLHTV